MILFMIANTLKGSIKDEGSPHARYKGFVGGMKL